MFCLMLIPFTFALLSAFIYHLAFLVDAKDTQFATDLLKELLLEPGETYIQPASVGRQVIDRNLEVNMNPQLRPTS